MTEPRFIPAAEYHAIKALSAGMIWTMDSECAAKAFIESPWNPNRAQINRTHFHIGTALHLAVLEDHDFDARTVSHEFDDYRTKEGREVRAGAWAQGKTPLKPAEQGVVAGMRAAIIEHPLVRYLLKNGIAEASIEWEWDGLPCKARPDYLVNDLTYMLDLKTTTTANPRVIGRKAFNEGWHVRAAWYTGGCKASLGTLPEHYLFVVVEVKAPHLVEIFEMDTRALLLGEKIIMRSLGRSAECLRTGKWPSYGDGGINTLILPAWQMAEREEEFNE